MKKAVSIIIACYLLCASIFSANALSENEIYQKRTSDLTIQDATITQKISTGLIAITDELLKKYDYNSDGVISILDTTIIQKYAAGIKREIPTEQTEPTATKLELNTYDIILGIGEKFKLSAKCDVENAKIEFESSSECVSVSNDGIITANSKGAAVITVKANGLSKQCNVSVWNAPSEVNLNYSSMTIGSEEQVTLKEVTDYGTYANSENLKWTSDNPNVIKITKNNDNVATAKAVGVGEVTVKLTLYNGIQATCHFNVKRMSDSLTLNAGSNMNLGVGEQYDFNSYVSQNTAAYFRDYSSSDESILSINKAGGLCTALKTGTVTVFCTLQNGVYASCTVTVMDSPSQISLNKEELNLKVGDVYDLKEHTNSGSWASPNTLIWQSSNNDVIKIMMTADNKCTVKAMSEGTSIITVTTGNGKSASCKISINGSNVKCIDVSTWQGNINFDKLKENGYDYVIIRAGYGRETYQKDDMFEANYRKAKAAGLKIGVYWFSYATYADEGFDEANACLYCLDKKELDMPVYYDLEYAPAIYNMNTSNYTQMAVNFCKSIERAGYKAGIYTSASVWKGYPLQRKTIQNCGYSIWNAEWSEYSSIDCDIWQFSDKYYVDGINGYVDCSYIYNLNIVN